MKIWRCIDVSELTDRRFDGLAHLSSDSLSIGVILVRLGYWVKQYRGWNGGGIEEKKVGQVRLHTERGRGWREGGAGRKTD